MKQKFFCPLLPSAIFLFIFMTLQHFALANWDDHVGTADITITGKIVNSLGEPISGASILVKNTTTGTSTNEQGEFSIVAPENAILVISFVGHVSQEVSVEGRTSIFLTLVSLENTMNEVVVVGYGSQRKKLVTAAVDQISGKEIAKRPVANVIQGLQGLSPGLNISYPGGKPGSTPDINIRGLGTVTGGGTPLIIIDGVASTPDDLLRLSPGDIASYTVLRDAASAAIYGARASFGVILLTTKQGASGGRQRITYNNYFSWSRRTVVPAPITDPYIYVRVLKNSVSPEVSPWGDAYVYYEPWQYQWAKERSDNRSVEDTRLNPDDPTKWTYMGDNNWNDYFFNKTSFSQNHNLSFSGGSEMGKGKPFGYLVSADYTKENGLNKLAKDDWNRYALRARVNFTPITGLKIDNNLNIYQTIAEAPSYPITNIYYLQPTDVAKNPDGTWANSGAGRLGAQLSGGGRDVQNRFGLQNIFKATASFLNNDLQITGSASIKRENWKYNFDYQTYKIGYGPTDIREEGGPTSVANRNEKVKQDVYDLYANYNKRLGDHDIKLLAGFNQEEFTWSRDQITRSNLISSSLPYIGLATGAITTSPDYTAYALRGIFGRINYTFKDRYILEVNGRRDGSSRFPKESRWGFFPSVSAAWIASEESFFQSLNKLISTLKFRASYGDLGNQVVGNFRYIPTLPVNTNFGYVVSGARPTVISGSPSLNVDPDTYTWEKVRVFNVGTDIGLMKDKLQIAFDYFTRKTIGMLIPGAALPGVIGTAPPPLNSGDLNTKGFELSVAYRNSFQVAGKPFGYGAKFILSDAKSKITKFNNAEGFLNNNYYVGQTIGEIWGLESDGFFRSQDEIDALDESAIVPWSDLYIVEGWPKYVDQNKDGKITIGQTLSDPGDAKIIGNSQARYRYGINLDADWNGFDFSVFLQGVAKQDFYPHHYLFWGPYQQPYAGIYEWNLDYYRATSQTAAERAVNSASFNAAGLADANTDSYFPVLQSWLADNNYRGSGELERYGLDMPQTRYLLNAAYLRVKNLTLGYTLPASLTKRFKISRFRVFVTGENLGEFSKIK
ncbi:MAG: SusC/RagA family TonB-linked outer membrane protein, partial [Chitinophagaceae bacterium]